MREFKFKEKYLVFLIATAFLVIGFYYSYAIFVTKQLQENVVAIETIKSSVLVLFNDTDSTIKVSGNSEKNYSLSIMNTGNMDSFYEVFFTGGKVLQVSVVEGEVKGQIKENEKKHLVVNIHNFDTDTVEITFVAKASSDEKIEKETGYRYINEKASFDHANANSPVIDGMRLIPVIYKKTDEKNGNWQKADFDNQKSLWYSYENGIWANAALVTDESYNRYLNAEVGTNIEMGDVLGFYVWIPRFKYTILNSSSYTNYERLYNVTFESGNATTGTITCTDKISNLKDKHLYSEVCEDKENGRIYDNLSTYTHPAFQDKNGFWVSKFLMADGSKGIKSIPSVPYLTKDINSAITLSEGLINGRSHMMTNMEYSSIVMLINSSYGKSSNSDYIKGNNYTFKKVYANSYILGQTGCSSEYDLYSRNYLLNESSVCIEYNDLTNYSHISNGINYPIGKIGPGASSTGTIYGVYDMVVKNGTLVAAFSADVEGNVSYQPKYYDSYSYNDYVGRITSSSNISNLYRYKLGDSIRENFRSFSINSMWQGGILEHKEAGSILLRGGTGDLKESSIYTGVFVNDDIEAPFRVSLF